jgi:hypothetical protein
MSNGDFEINGATFFFLLILVLYHFFFASLRVLKTLNLCDRINRSGM